VPISYVTRYNSLNSHKQREILMSVSPQTRLRLPPQLVAACERQAAKQSLDLSVYISQRLELLLGSETSGAGDVAQAVLAAWRLFERLHRRDVGLTDDLGTRAINMVIQMLAHASQGISNKDDERETESVFELLLTLKRASVSDLNQVAAISHIATKLPARARAKVAS
jgi:hypothetical protein